MVRVVVVDRDSARLPDELEAPSRAAELREHRRRVGGIDLAQLEGGERTSSVTPVVLPSQGQRDVGGIELQPRTACGMSASQRSNIASTSACDENVV